MTEDLKEKIYNKLIEIDSNVFYGLATQNFLNNTPELNYIIYSGNGFSKASSKIDLVNYFTVSVIRENFVPDDTVQKVIFKMLSIPGIRLSDEKAENNYIRKGNTDTLIEITSITFAIPRKGYFDKCQ